MHNNAHYDRLQAELRELGFNLVAGFRVGDLSDSISQNLPAFGRIPSADQTLILVASGGTALWDAMGQTEHGAPSRQSAQQDPIDRYSVTSLRRCLDRFTMPDERALLYPTELSLAASHYTGALPKTHVSLQQLGMLADWHQPSPMGIGIHREFGLWFAYRALVLLDWAFDAPPPSAPFEAPALDNLVCTRCQSVDCVASCPADAVNASSLPDMHACGSYRISENSACQTQCLARKSCPVGKSLRYHDAQIEYHYSISLESIKNRRKKTS